MEKELPNTIVIWIEDVPKKDGIETNIEVVYPQWVNEEFKDYTDPFDFYDMVRTDYNLVMEYHITPDKTLEVWSKS